MGVSGMTVESLEHGRYTVASDAVSKKIRVGRDGGEWNDCRKFGTWPVYCG